MPKNVGALTLLELKIFTPASDLKTYDAWRSTRSLERIRSVAQADVIAQNDIPRPQTKPWYWGSFTNSFRLSKSDNANYPMPAMKLTQLTFSKKFPKILLLIDLIHTFHYHRRISQFLTYISIDIIFFHLWKSTHVSWHANDQCMHGRRLCS